MYKEEGITDWETYARLREEAWQEEHKRQTAAYQQLESEMVKLLELLEDSQRNQNDWMTESTRLFEHCAEDFQELRSLFGQTFGEGDIRSGSVNARVDAVLRRLEAMSQGMSEGQQALVMESVSNAVSESGERPGVVMIEAADVQEQVMELDAVDGNFAEVGRESDSTAKVHIKAKQSESPSLWKESPQLVHASHSHSSHALKKESSSNRLHTPSFSVQGSPSRVLK